MIRRFDQSAGQWMVLFLLLVAGAGWVRSDTVTLKDGTVIEGTVVSKDEQTVSIRFATAGGTIFQTQQVKVSDIAAIKILTEEERSQEAMERDFAILAKLKVHPTQSYRLEDYDRVLQRFQSFQAQYTNSPHLAALPGLMAPWEAERAQVAAGMVKNNGEWLSKTEAGQQASAAQARQFIDQARQQFADGQYLRALQLLNQVLALPADPDIKTEAKGVIAEIYSAWYPYLDRRATELQSELTKARAEFQAADSELKQAQSAIKIDPGFNKSGGQSSLSGDKINMGAGSARAQAAARVAKAKERLAKAEAVVKKLEREEQIVVTYLGFARDNAQQLGISETVAAIEQAKNPTTPGQEKSSTDKAIDRQVRRLAPETGDTPGILVDLSRWVKNNWPLAGGLLAFLLYLLYKYLIDR
jgi:hypothetical protein